MGTPASIGVWIEERGTYLYRECVFDGYLSGKGIALVRDFPDEASARRLVEDDSVWLAWLSEYERKYAGTETFESVDNFGFFFRWGRWWHWTLDASTTNGHSAMMPVGLHFTACYGRLDDDPEWIAAIGAVDDALRRLEMTAADKATLAQRKTDESERERVATAKREEEERVRRLASLKAQIAQMENGD